MVSNRLRVLGSRLLLEGLSDASRRGTACATEQQQPFPNYVSPPTPPSGAPPRGPTLPPQPHRISAASRRMLPRMSSMSFPPAAPAAPPSSGVGRPAATELAGVLLPPLQLLK